MTSFDSWIVASCGGVILCASTSAQVTERVSVSTTGQQANAASFFAAVSTDGRFVAFQSAASNLLDDGSDTNGYQDIFVRDRLLGTTERVSVANDGSQASGGFPAISGDGRYVAFDSSANVVPNDTNGVSDIFVRDRQNATTERISVATGGMQGSFDSYFASISADGRFVTFATASQFDQTDMNGVEDIYLRDRQLGITELVSVGTGGIHGDAPCHYSAVSADGRFVAFESAATNLVGGDTNGVSDIFVRDRQLGTTERVSVSTSGAQAMLPSQNPSISADGRFVAFDSNDSMLVMGDTNAATDIFVRDRQLGTTVRVSVATDGTQGTVDSSVPSISASGQYIAFHSGAPNLVPNDTNVLADVFVHDLVTGTTVRVSVDTDGHEANGGVADNTRPAISADGRCVAFTDSASSLVQNDTNNFDDVFIHEGGSSGFTSSCDAGVGTVIPCPCANPPSSLGRGCNNSSATGGAILSASGFAHLSMDSLVFTTTGEKPTALSILTQWTGGSAHGDTFGQGLRCTSGSFKRLFTKSAVAGSITAPNFGAGDPTVSARSAARGNVINPGESRWYFVYYRDAAVLGGCPSTATFNATQTGRVDWSL